jgi:hypothetical protein
MLQQGQEPPRLAGTGGGHAQIGPRKKRRARDLGQEPLGQVAVQSDEPGVGGLGRPQRAIRQGGPQDLVARRLQRMGVRDGRDQPVCPLDRHVDIGWQIVGAVQMRRLKPQSGALRHQFITLGVAAHRA